MAIGPVVSRGFGSFGSNYLVALRGYKSGVPSVVFPPIGSVLHGVTYGPNGNDYTGTLNLLYDVKTGKLVKVLTGTLGMTL